MENTILWIRGLKKIGNSKMRSRYILGNGYVCLEAGGGRGTLEGGSKPKGNYTPMDAEGNPIPLAKQRINNQDLPLPDPNAQGPHTVLGGKISSELKNNELNKL